MHDAQLSSLTDTSTRRREAKVDAPIGSRELSEPRGDTLRRALVCRILSDLDQNEQPLLIKSIPHGCPLIDGAHLTTYEVSFSHNTVDALETFTHVTQRTVSGVPDYLTGSAITAHIQARLLQDNPAFRRIRNLTILGDGIV
jgi:hypothetical protein